MTTVADILGAEAAAGDPDAVARAAHALAQLADHAASAESRLRAARAGAWRGPAADAFAEHQQGQLPAQLGVIAQACHLAEQSLTAYAGALGAAQAHARLLATQRDQAVEECHRRTAAATAASTHATATARAAATAVEPGDRARRSQAAAAAKAGAARAHAAREAAEERIRQIDRQAEQLRNEHRVKAHQCRQSLDEARGRGGHSDGLGGVLAAGGLALLKWGTDAFSAATDWAGKTITELRDDGDALTKQYIKVQQRVREWTGGHARGGVVERTRKIGKAGGKVVTGLGLLFYGADAYDDFTHDRPIAGSWDVLWGGLSVTPPGAVFGVIDFATGGIYGKEGLISGTFTGFWADVGEDGFGAASDRCLRGEYGPALQGMSLATTEVGYQLGYGPTQYLVEYATDGGDVALSRAESGAYGGAVQMLAKGETAVIDSAWKAGESVVNWWKGGR